MYPYIAFLALLQAPAQPAGVPLTEDCSDSAPVLANLSASAQVEVRSSVAGYAKTCYAVTAVVGGKPVKGYVLGSGLPAIAEFERERAAVTAASIVPPLPESCAAAIAPVTVEGSGGKTSLSSVREFFGGRFEGKGGERSWHERQNQPGVLLVAEQQAGSIVELLGWPGNCTAN